MINIVIKYIYIFVQLKEGDGMAINENLKIQ